MKGNIQLGQLALAQQNKHDCRTYIRALNRRAPARNGCLSASIAASRIAAMQRRMFEYLFRKGNGIRVLHSRTSSEGFLLPFFFRLLK